MTRRSTRMPWCEHQPEDAAHYHVLVFGNSRVRDSLRSGDAGPGRKGLVMVPGLGQRRGSER